jgi:hypothetical protein
MKKVVFWDVAQCGSCKNRRYGGIYRLHHQGRKYQRAKNKVRINFLQLLAAYVVPS